ncbi:unnamed protein product [Clonostachys rosea f. rosea IK726]|uniref:Uncharacterized protein n=1 Tax=Clonostachys rosea f. rosea IK726 TaxID=1349383 RepID=A0ACA9U7S0_BIOOC|nr:unnamed protein product [Clonostachys rosea f. rosea IK726]
MSDIALPSSYLSDLKRSIPTLVGIDNWPDWIDQIKTIANRLEIWAYIDPDKSTQLTAPTYEDHPSLEELADPSRRENESETAFQTRLDQFNESLQGRVIRLQLITSQVESRNRDLRRDYEKKKYSLLAILNLIDGSISKELQVLLKGKEGDARERIKALKDHIRPDDQYETLAATTAFWTQARATGSRNWATWADQIKVAYIRCSRLPQEPIPKELAVSEFLGAIRDTFPAFYGPWNKERRTAGSAIDPIILFSKFKAEALIKKTQSASLSVNAANAAKPKSPEGGRPRGRGKKSPIEKCPGCLIKHPRAQGTSNWWESCYAFQKTYGKAPNQMVRDWTVKEGIKKNLKSWFEKHPDEKRKALSWNPSTEEGTQEDIIPGEGLSQQKTAYSLGRLELGADEWIADHRNPAWSEISDDESNSPTAASWISDEDGSALTPGSAESDEESSHWTEESRTYKDLGNRQTTISQDLEYHGQNRTALATCNTLPSAGKIHYSQPAKKKVVSRTEESQATDSSGHCQTQGSSVTDCYGKAITSQPPTNEEVSQGPTTKLGSSDSHGRSRIQRSRTKENSGNKQTIRPGPSDSHGRNLTERSRTRDKVSNRETQGSREAAAAGQKETTAPRAADQGSHDWTHGSRIHDTTGHEETHGSRTHVEAGNSKTTRSRDHDNNGNRETARSLTYDMNERGSKRIISSIQPAET